MRVFDDADGVSVEILTFFYDKDCIFCVQSFIFVKKL